MATIFMRFLCDEDGATSIEYAMIAALMAITAIAAVSALGKNVSVMYNDIDGAMDGAVNGGS